MKVFFKKFLSILYSLRAQILVMLIAAGLIPLFIFLDIYANAYNKSLINKRTDEIKTYGTVINNLIISSDYLSYGDSSEVDNEVDEVAEIYDGRILIVDNNLRIVKDTYNIETGKTVITKDVIKSFNTQTGEQYSSEYGDYIQLTIPIVENENKTVIGALIMSFSKHNLHLVTENVTNNIKIIIAIITFVILIVSVGFSGYITKPLKKITGTINEMNHGNMDVKLEEKGYSEVKDISKSFNAMIDTINQQEESRQEFVSNVSHELKTPLASVKVLADSLLTQEDTPVEFYREFMGDINNEIERMSDIVTDLLSMSRLEKKSATMEVTNLSINELIERLLKRFRPIADKRKIELIYESFRPVSADIDEVKFSIAINNLIENAIKYNFDSGWVKITLNADHQYFYITVEDSGVGIPEEFQNRVFERFYRVDKARSRETGGTGLGLAITRKVILLHNGTIKVYSKEREGTTFKVRVPLTYAFNQSADEV
ncbi:MAG: HAMP domain-containing histidine kinase [Lachnospiraceae bacterium]|nr:HAMP domain-containing histidine kinase [Lachnospiraceae bacterium]